MWTLHEYESEWTCCYKVFYFNLVSNQFFFAKTKPFYHEAAKLLKDDPTYKSDKKIVLAKIDATAASASGWTSRFNIKGFPTLKIIRKGEITFYEGPRSPAKG